MLLERDEAFAGTHKRDASPSSRLPERRAVADGLYRRNKLVEAQDAYLRLLEASIDVGWCLYQLGRIAAGQLRWAEALQRFDAALSEEMSYVWNHYEKAKALENLNADTADVLRELVLFVSGQPQELKHAHFRYLMGSANKAFEAGLFDEAAVVFAWLAQHGRGGYFCGLRRAELHLKKKDAEEALRIVEELASDPKYSLRGDVVKAQSLLHLGRNKQAVGILKSVVLRAPDNVNFIRVLFEALERDGDTDQLRQPEEFLRGLPHDEQFEFLLKARLVCQDHQGIAELCSQYPISVTSSHVQLISRAIHACIQMERLDTTAILFETAGGIDSGSPRLIAARLRSLFVQKDLKGAGRLLGEVDRLISETGDAELRLRKLEYLCLNMQLDEAEIFLAEWRSLGDIPEIATSAAAGLYAALGRWNDVLDLFHDRVRQGIDISREVLLDAVARAARRTGRYAEVLQNLQNLLRGSPDKKLSDFHDRMLAEIHLVQDLDSADISASRASSNQIDNSLYAHRATLLSRTLSGASQSPAERNIYFCSDANYLAGTCVALFSLLRSNFSIGKSCSISVVCADDVLEFATNICERIGAAFSVPIRMRAASSMLGDARKFKSGWGLFTPDPGLSDAAYYRIFMAQQLLTEGVGGRALYIDSDTCVGSGIAEIFEFDLQKHPLGARPEVGLPEIVHAAFRLGIEPAKYFNSGVLLFDLSHPDLPSALNHSIHISLHQQEMLTFVDQCALNVAFRDRNVPLPETFNWFLRHTAEPQVMVEEPAIVHFLARPKPWDPMYDSVHCMRWVREFAMLGELLTTDMRKRLLAHGLLRPTIGPTVTADIETFPSPA